MVAYSEHGGRCCGYLHLHGMDHCTLMMFDQHINMHFTDGNANRVLEVILSQRQVESGNGNDGGRIHQSIIDAGGWAAVLAERGFRLTASWLNSNSSRRCYQFIKTTSWLSMSQRSLRFTYPQELVAYRGEGNDIEIAVAPPPPAPLPPPHVVYSLYHNVFRTSGRSNAGWPTFDQARGAAPHATSVDLMDIYSDGTSRWIEGVRV